MYSLPWIWCRTIPGSFKCLKSCSGLIYTYSRYASDMMPMHKCDMDRSRPKICVVSSSVSVSKITEDHHNLTNTYSAIKFKLHPEESFSVPQSKIVTFLRGGFVRSLQGLHMKSRLLACLLIWAVLAKYNNTIYVFISVLNRFHTGNNHYFMFWVLGISVCVCIFYWNQRMFLYIWHITSGPK